jgi:hypothetical protein
MGTEPAMEKTREGARLPTAEEKDDGTVGEPKMHAVK